MAESCSAGEPRIKRIAVVVPVRNEERLLGRCLRGLQRAMDVFEAGPAQRTASALLVLDDCRDASASIAEGTVRADPRFAVLETDVRAVGAARRAGAEAVLCGLGLRRHAESWLACTDADSLVPPHWLSGFAALADAGADAVLGLVEPDPADTAAALMAAWRARYDRERRFDRVHGANLGVRASAYLRAGGFSSSSAHEDVSLVRALRRLGLPIAAAPELTVLTSGRLDGRAPEGFAAYLGSLSHVDERSG